MSDASFQRSPGEVIYHFDVKRSSIPLSQFIDTARATQDIINAFNENLFDNSLKYDLHVATPEEGGLIEVLTIVVGVPGSVLAFLATDIGKAFFKGLTTQQPEEWAEAIGSLIREQVGTRKGRENEEEQTLPTVPSGELRGTVSEAELDRFVAGELLAYLLIRFLEVEAERLRSIGITPEKFRTAFQARNRIFKACIDNKEVEGLTFDRSHDFQLQRSDFPKRVIQLPDSPPEEPEEVTDWSIETVDIIVNSPNWKRDGRKWQAATPKHQDIAFSIEDEQFWFAVERKDIQPDIRDNMRVQWAYPAGLSKPSHVRVLRVVSYNGKPISEPMTDQQLREQLEVVHFIEPDPPDLFDERRGDNHKKEEGGD